MAIEPTESGCAGDVTVAVHSLRLKMNIGYAMAPISRAVPFIKRQ